MTEADYNAQAAIKTGHEAHNALVRPPQNNILLHWLRSDVKPRSIT